jgi:CYTH domain-containing protein
MAKEIEVKYLVSMQDFPFDVIPATSTNPYLSGKLSVQGYLSSDEGHATRLQIRTRSINGLTPETPIMFKDVYCYMNIKGSRDMETRDEFEFPFPKRFACDVLNLVDERIMKIRFATRVGWDVDMYVGSNAGLVVAEKEYPTIEELRADSIPFWCIRNLTYEDKFYNRNLAITPFTELDNFEEIVAAIHGDRECMGDFVQSTVAPYEKKIAKLLDSYAKYINESIVIA